ncbi:MAG: hypothetical protein LUQ14_02065 [Methanomassiliicoccales archaeon]|nr:hypothetical protein [Methanomassiliicoccales archaeon]
MFKASKIRLVIVSLLLLTSLICLFLLLGYSQRIDMMGQVAITAIALTSIVLAFLLLMYVSGSPERIEKNGRLAMADRLKFPEGTYLGPRDQFSVNLWTVYQDEDRRYPEGRRKERN